MPTVAELDALGPDYPVGVSEIAAALGFERQSADMWRHRGKFPDEAGPFRIGGRPWWKWGVVRAWAIETGRLESPDAEPIDPPLRKGQTAVKIPKPRHRSQ